MIERRRTMGNNNNILPAGYKQIEYIQTPNSSRFAYIDTGIYLTVYKCIGEFKQPSYVNDCCLFGAWSNVVYHVTYYNNRYYFGVGDSYEYNVSYTTSAFDNNWHLYELSRDGLFYVDNTLLYNNYIAAPIQTSVPLHIFDRSNNAHGWGTMCKTFSIINYVTNEVIWNGIPCISPNNVVGMYDTISGQFFSSPNGIAFIAGPEV